MLCRNPYVNTVGQVFGCGQCMPCRINKRRIWVHRMELEASLHGDNSFVSLTYADPEIGPPRGNLQPDDVTRFFKRLRKVSPPFRYFYCGEYGEASWRPHYHALLFGFPACFNGGTRYPPRWSKCCSVCDSISDVWGLGRIQSVPFTANAASYVAGYVTKKLTASCEALGGRVPEFARMSRMPGLGAPIVPELSRKWMEYAQFMSDDVPHGLGYGRAVRPIGRYMRQRWRVGVGHDSKATQSSMDESQKALLPLRWMARDEAVSLKDVIVRENATRAGSYLSRSRIYKERRSI